MERRLKDLLVELLLAKHATEATILLFVRGGGFDDSVTTFERGFIRERKVRRVVAAIFPGEAYLSAKL